MGRNWKEFEGCPIRVDRNEIYVTLNVTGEFVLNRYAYNMMNRPEAVVLLFDPDTDTIGIKPAGRRMPNSFPLKLKGNCDNYVIRTKPFCLEHDIRIDGTVRFRTAAVEDDVLVLDLRMMTKATRKKRVKAGRR